MPKPGYKMLSKTCKLSDSAALSAVNDAIMFLGMARDKLKDAGCPLTLDRVRLALSSAKGAYRSVAHRKYRRERT